MVASLGALALAITGGVVVTALEHKTPLGQGSGGTEASVPPRLAANVKFMGENLRFALDTDLDSAGAALYAIAPGEPRRTDANGVEDPEKLVKLERHLRQQGAYYVDKLQLQISLQGLGDAPIRIRNIRLTDLDRSRSIGHTLLTYPHGSDEETYKLGFVADEASPVAREELEDGYGAAFFTNRTLSISKDDDDVLLLTIEAQKYAHSFRIAIDFTAVGRDGTAIIDDEGRPFRLTGEHCQAPGQPSEPYKQVWDAFLFEEGGDGSYAFRGLKTGQDDIYYRPCEWYDLYSTTHFGENPPG